MTPASQLRRRSYSAERPPVLLLGGLNVLRALGLAGIPVIVGSSCPDDVTFASRYCSGRLVLPELDDARAVVDALLRAGERLAGELGRPVPLFYSNDKWQRLVQDHRTELSRHYLLLLNDVETADALIDKDRFQPFALARGVPVPRTLEWDALERLAEPVLVKPCAKYHGEHSPAHRRLFGSQGKARIFPTGRALAADASARELRESLLVQEYVDGDDRQIWSFHGFADEHSQLLDWFIGRKIRTYPALTGTSTYLELSRDDELAALGKSTVAALGLKGVFKIDLKRDSRSGRFRVLEVNARYNLWHYLSAANGLNLARTAYEYLVHRARPVEPGRYGTRYRWIFLRFDWLAYRELAARGELGFFKWLGSIAFKPKVCQLFRWDDPLPLFYRLRYFASRLPRIRTAMRRWLSTAS